jgi:hypothetical protein
MYLKRSIPFSEAILGLYNSLTGSSLPLQPDDPNNPEGDALSELLADLMHFCEAKGLDFDRAMERAAYYFETDLQDTDPSEIGD